MSQSINTVWIWCVFINGLPLVVFHGLHGSGEAWSLRATYLQLQECKARLPKFFSLNELLVLSNCAQFRIGTLTTQWKQFIQVRSANGEEVPFKGEPEIATLIQGVFDKRRLLEIIQHFIVFPAKSNKIDQKVTV